MPIILDYQLREQIPHNATEFPVTYYHDELVTLPNLTGPLHWHPDFEIATATNGVFILPILDDIIEANKLLH